MLKLISKNTGNIMVLRNVKLCAAVQSKWRKPRPKFDVTDARFESELPKDPDALKDREGKR